MKKLSNIKDLPQGIEVQTNGDCVWIKVGNMTIYAEANCPTRDDKVEEFISIHKKDSSEKTSLLMYGDEVVSINDRTYNDFYGKVLLVLRYCFLTVKFSQNKKKSGSKHMAQSTLEKSRVMTSLRRATMKELFEESIRKQVEDVKETDVKSLSNLCNDLLTLEAKIGNTEEELRRYKEQSRELSEQVIPDKLAELGVSDLKLSDGSRISAEPFYSARITAQNLQTAHEWLRENGHGDIIKNTLTITFGQGEDVLAKELVDQLAKQGYMPETKEAVHPSTLRAFVKERIESGDPSFDVSTQKSFSVYTGKRTKINR